MSEAAAVEVATPAPVTISNAVSAQEEIAASSVTTARTAVVEVEVSPMIIFKLFTLRAVGLTPHLLFHNYLISHICTEHRHC